jgi:hypothetical protein
VDDGTGWLIVFWIIGCHLLKIQTFTKRYETRRCRWRIALIYSQTFLVHKKLARREETHASLSQSSAFNAGPCLPDYL